MNREIKITITPICPSCHAMIDHLACRMCGDEVANTPDAVLIHRGPASRPGPHTVLHRACYEKILPHVKEPEKLTIIPAPGETR